jgi:hypothetical protein
MATTISSIEQMRSAHSDEWLLIAYTELDDQLNVIQGELLAHSPNAEDLYKLLPSFSDRAVAFEYVGEIPQELAFVV